MKVNGTLINYYYHCKRQCYLHGNIFNHDDNSEQVKNGLALHYEKNNKENTEIALENIKLDKMTDEYLTEMKKSDADVEAAKWQLLFYLKILKDKGIIRKGKLEFVEKGKGNSKILYFDLTEEEENKLQNTINEIEKLLDIPNIPEVLNKPKCKKCAYYEYCYI